jgi:hypothetical protein
MKITTYAESEWDDQLQRYVTTYSEGYEYDGAVAQCGGGGKAAPPPPPTAEEVALQKEQANQLRIQSEILQEQRNLNNLLLLPTLEAAGFRPIFGDGASAGGGTGGSNTQQLQNLNAQISQLNQQIAATPQTIQTDATTTPTITPTGPVFGQLGAPTNAPNPAYEQLVQQRAALESQLQTASASGGLGGSSLVGGITGIERIVDPLEDRRKGIEEAFLTRTEKALAGELPENPALLADLREQEQSLNEKLQRQLGPGFETSTPGIQALSQFDEFKEGILESARRGDLTLAESLGLARENAAFTNQQADFGNLSSLRQFNSQIAQGTGQVASGFGAAQQPFQQNRQMQFQINQQNANRPNAFGSLFGTIAGGFAGNPGFFDLFT